LIPLDQLLTDDRLFSATDPRAATAYGQAWALVSYLLAERPGAFFGYLRMVSRTRAGQPDREPARLVGFRQAFGEDFAAVEAAVAAYVTSLG
jgi:hypothetical protein